MKGKTDANGSSDKPWSTCLSPPTGSSHAAFHCSLSSIGTELIARVCAPRHMLRFLQPLTCSFIASSPNTPFSVEPCQQFTPEKHPDQCWAQAACSRREAAGRRRATIPACNQVAAFERMWLPDSSRTSASNEISHGRCFRRTCTQQLQHRKAVQLS
eukprot:764571-Hanusia_phi.AAC.2